LLIWRVGHPISAFCAAFLLLPWHPDGQGALGLVDKGSPILGQFAHLRSVENHAPWGRHGKTKGCTMDDPPHTWKQMKSCTPPMFFWSVWLVISAFNAEKNITLDHPKSRVQNQQFVAPTGSPFVPWSKFLVYAHPKTSWVDPNPY
jgi:hypothetical protein